MTNSSDQQTQLLAEVFKTAFEENVAPTAIFKLDTTIVMANQAYCRVSGLSAEEVIGVSWLSQIPPDDIERLKEFNKTRLAGSEDVPGEYDFKFYNKQGDIRNGHMFVKLIKDYNLIITSFVDITDQKNNEKIILQQRDELKNNIVRLDKEFAFQTILIENYKKHVTSLIESLLNLRKLAVHENSSILSFIEKIIENVEENQQVFSWVKLKEKYLDMHPEFMSGLLTKHPNLTPAEVKLCTLLHLNLDTKEIAAITSQTYDSTRVARTRLRKKLGLNNENSLIAYLLKF